VSGVGERHADLAAAAAPIIKKPPPGPRSVELRERLEKVVWSGMVDTMPIVITRKHGSVMEDVDGNIIVDMVTGWGCTNIGATHPYVAGPTVETLLDYGVEISDYIVSPPVVELAEKLVSIAPDPLKRVSFEVSGTEAVESSLRFMREKRDRANIITFIGQYHGESYAAQAVGSQQTGYARHVRELMGGYVHVPYPNPYRCPFHRNEADCDGTCVIDYLREQILRYVVTPDSVAGVMIEPVAGEAGVWIPPDPFWPALMDLCEEHGWLWCDDESEALFGRCGPMFACERWDLHPDLMVLAKALSGGMMPIAATLGSEEVLGQTQLFTGGTFTWPPASATAALKGIEVIEKENMLAGAARLEQLALEHLKPLKDKYELVGDVRVVGAWSCVEFVKDRDTKEWALEEAASVHFGNLKGGVAGIYDHDSHLIRWQPALNMPEDMFIRACDIMDESIAAVAAAR